MELEPNDDDDDNNNKDIITTTIIFIKIAWSLYNGQNIHLSTFFQFVLSILLADQQHYLLPAYDFSI